MDPKRLVIVDGYSLLFRAFFGSRYLSTSDGRPTNALFGFTNMLFTLLEREAPDAVVVAFDAPGNTFRHDAYEAYKGTRKEVQPELVQQLPIARDLIGALGFAQLELVGYEADDVVGTISRLAEENGYHTTIVTGDLDSLQLVDECVSVMTTRQGVTDIVVYTPEAVEARYGFGPERIPDYKALVGDTSDNIPGVPGIGEKSATKLIQQFGTVEEIIERLPEVEEKFRKKIEPHIEQLRKSKWLATIDRNVPLEYDFAPYRITDSGLEQAKEMLDSLEFRSLRKKIDSVLSRYRDGADGEPAPKIEIKTEAIDVRFEDGLLSREELDLFLDGRDFALVIPAARGQLAMFDGGEPKAYLAVGSDVRCSDIETALSLFRENPERVTTHDAKPLFHRADYTSAPVGFDTMLAGYVLQSGRSSYQLSDLAQGYLDVAPPATPEAQTACLMPLCDAMSDRLHRENQMRVLREIELPVTPILAEMEMLGICASREFLEDFSHSLEGTIQATASRIYELAGIEFLIGSPKQLGEVLFDRMGLPAPKKTKTGYATGAEVLSELVNDYPIAREVLTWRELTKLKSTYSDALPKMIREDGRIHTSFNQTVAATGRLSSNEPNLQNIPIRTDLGRSIRKAFVSAEGFRLASFDYSQIELRLLAHLCRDEALVEAFQERVDVHTVTASLMFNIEKGEVTREQRRLAKMLNYAVLYGVTDFGLQQQLGEGFGVSEARALIKQYNERFPKVKAFTESVVAEAKQKGFTMTLWGRRRYFPDIHAANRSERQYAERQAMNAPIQGAAADLVKLAMIEVRKRLGASATRMLLQVHDELVFELADGDEGLIEPIREAMESAMPLDVPIEVDAKVGKNWGEMAPVSR